MGVPDEHTIGEMPAAVDRVLRDDAYRSEARRIADAMRELPPVDTSVDALVAISAR